MRRPLITVLTFLSLATLTGCASFGSRDEQLLERVGGSYVPSGEAWFARAAPVFVVSFDPAQHVLTDDDLRLVFPSLRRVDSVQLDLSGSRVSDESIPLINSLRSLRSVDLNDTQVTAAGIGRLRKNIQSKRQPLR